MWRAGLLSRWRRDARGVTAVEFAILGPAFLLLILGCLEFGLELLTQLDLDNAAQAAARQIEIGAAPSASSFAADVCAGASVLIVSCTSKIQVYVTSGSSYSGLTAGSVNASGVLSPTTYNAGNAGSSVLVQVAYTRPFDINWFTQLFGASQTLLSTYAVMNEPAGS